jgi:hypothetical protein
VAGRSERIAVSFFYWSLRRLLELLVLRRRSEREMEIEILLLRHQLHVLERQVARPQLTPTDRALLAAFSQVLVGAGSVRTISMPSPQKLWSNARLNFVSRSWITKRGRWLRSSRSISRLRACGIIPGRVGIARAGDVFDAARSDRDEEQHTQAAQPDGVDGQPLSFSA